MLRMLGICFVLWAAGPLDSVAAVPDVLRRSFSPPAQFVGDFGNYRSPLMFEDGTPVRTAADWVKRREQILATWWNLIGRWPPLIEKPQVRHLEQTRRDNFTQHKVSVEIAPNGQMVAGYLLVPDSRTPPQRPRRHDQP